MIAPGFVGVRVAPGRHRVLFAYHAYPFYWVWFAFGAIVMIALLFFERRVLRRPASDGAVTLEPGTD